MNAPAYPTSPPPAGPVRLAGFPPVAAARLDNGLRVLAIQNDKLPLIALRLVILAGSVHEADARGGASEFVAALLDQGTASRSGKQIAEDIDAVGAALSVSPGSDCTIVAGDALSKHIDTLLAVAAEVTTQASFPIRELENERLQKISELVEQRGQPDFLAHERLARALYGSHPYGRISPAPAEVQAISVTALEEFHSRWYRPNNAILVLAGDLSAGRAFDLAARHFGPWQKAQSAEVAELALLALPAIAPRRNPEVVIVDRPASVQTNILVGGIALERADPDYIPLSVSSYILGGGPASRLFMNLRETKGYTYGAYSRVSARRLGGDWSANAEVRNEVSGEALAEIFAEVARMSDEDVAPPDLGNAQAFLAGVFAIQNESIHALAANAASLELYGLAPGYWDRYRQEIFAVDIPQVRQMAQRYLVASRACVVLVGKKELLQPLAAPYGPTTIYDSQGELL